MATNNFVYWSDGLGAGHLVIMVGTRGGAFAIENCPQGRSFEHFFQMPGGLPGGGDARGWD